METHRYLLSGKGIYQVLLPALITHISLAVLLQVSSAPELMIWIGSGIVLHSLYFLRIHFERKELISTEQNTKKSTKLSIASLVTLWRGGMLTSAITAVLFAPQLAGRILIIACLFLIAILLDALDGYLARRFDQQTVIGTMLDTETDGYAMLAGVVMASWQGLLSVEFMAAGLAYYVFVFAGNRRRIKGKELQDLLPGSFRRTMAGFMMGFIAVALSGVFSNHAVHIVGRIYLLFFIVLFIFDWLTVSGRLKQGGDLLLVIQALLARGLFDMLPMVLRAALCFIIIIAFKGQDYYPVYIAFSLVITAGILSRTLAVLLMLLLGWHLTISGSSPFADLALAYTATIALLGAGAFAIWQPEEKWINR